LKKTLIKTIEICVALINHLDDEAREVRFAVTDTIAVVGRGDSDVATMLIDRIQTATRLTKINICSSLSDIGVREDRVLAALFDVLNEDRGGDIKERILYFLKSVRMPQELLDPGVVANLVEAFPESTRYTKLYADLEEFVDVVIEVLKTGKSTAKVAAAKCVLNLNRTEETSVNALAQAVLLVDTDPVVSTAAAQTLKQLGIDWISIQPEEWKGEDPY